MRLFLDTGHSERTARRDIPRGACLEIVPETGRDSGRGALFACAEALPDGSDAQTAARVATTALADSYYAAPEGWGLKQALEESLDAAHHALLGGGERGRAAVLAALVLRGRRWLVAHAGHARVWLFRDNQLKQLTRDHLLPLPARRAQILKACGLESAFNPDCASGELAQGDLFLVSSPALNEALEGAQFMAVLQSDATVQQMADMLTARALEAGSNGYLAAAVVRVEQLPAESIGDTDENIADLAFVDLPAPGVVVDGFRIDKLVHRSRRFQVYKATDEEHGTVVALKFPDAACRTDPECVRAFLREEWIGRRIDSPHLVKALKLRPGRRQAFYTVTDYHQGENLAKRIRRKGTLPVEEALLLGEQLLAALEALHSHGVVHRDVRANHLMYDKKNRRLLVLGLGESRVQGLAEGAERSKTSAWTYRAPELLAGQAANERSDIFAAGVTLYHMLTGEYPYGKIKTPGPWEGRAYRPMQECRPDIPDAIEDVVRRACALAPEERFASVAQFTSALSRVQATSAPSVSSSPTLPPSGRTGAQRWTWLWVGTLFALLVGYLVVALR